MKREVDRLQEEVLGEVNVKESLELIYSYFKESKIPHH
jgi:hypothetical protein